MEVTIPDKAYYRIGEVSKILDVPTYVLRYWESEFKTIKPIRTPSSQRLYRKQDVEEFLLIKNLLYREKFTIRGAKQQLLKIRSETHSEDEREDRLVLIKKGLLQIRAILQ